MATNEPILDLAGRSLNASVRITRCDRWEPLASLLTGDRFLVPNGECESALFDQAAQLDFLEWLDGAEWLDTLSPDALEQLPEVLGRFGAITLSQPETAPRFRLGPDGLVVDQTGHVTDPLTVLRLNGFRLATDTVVEDQRVRVDAVELLDELWCLRAGLRLALAMARGEDNWREEMARGAGPFNVTPAFLQPFEDESAPAIDSPTFRAQVWFVSRIIIDGGLRAIPQPSVGPMRLAFVPVSPRQQLWLTLAVTAGVIDPPVHVDGFMTCDYSACPRKVFFSKTARSKGKYRFCSPECGRHFWAARSTRAKRAREKEELRAERERGVQ